MPTLGRESCMFHVRSLTFKNTGGRDCLFWGGAAESPWAVAAGVLCVEGNKACNPNRRANTLAGHARSARPKSHDRCKNGPRFADCWGILVAVDGCSSTSVRGFRLSMRRDSRQAQQPGHLSPASSRSRRPSDVGRRLG
jgi:hypothetical protein